MRRHTIDGYRLLHRPQHALRDEPAIFRHAPVFMEMKSAESERTPAVGPLPCPGDGLGAAVDVDLDDRLAPLCLPELVVELIADPERLESERNCMLCSRQLRGDRDDLILSLRPAVTAAEEIDEAGDVVL